MTNPDPNQQAQPQPQAQPQGDPQPPPGSEVGPTAEQREQGATDGPYGIAPEDQPTQTNMEQAAQQSPQAGPVEVDPDSVGQTEQSADLQTSAQQNQAQAEQQNSPEQQQAAQEQKAQSDQQVQAPAQTEVQQSQQPPQ